MTTTVFGAVTRKKVRVAAATVLSASSSVEFRKSTLTGLSRNAGSKIRLMFAIRAMPTKTSRLVASRKVRVAGMRTPCGRSRPGGGISRARSISDWSSVLPSRATCTFVRSLLRVFRSSSSSSPLPGFSSMATSYSASA